MEKLWSHWKLHTKYNVKKDNFGFSMSFINQMAEIDGEMERVLADNKRLERIRTDVNYRGEPQIIQRLFKIIKKDPKNIALRREIDVAEKETYDFLGGAEDAPSAEYMKEYWSKYLQAYIAEIQQKKRV